MPDVVGHKLEKALHMLEGHGFEIVIKETFGRKNTRTGEARVIRQRIYKDNILQLIIAYF
ncbi:MAG: PASTA domain-containing protein [Candidatus Alkaliphilus sp. MAG34]|nr:PASTA domain-containing protein [Clostridiales bacterium]